jgi:hypothetical protein
VFFVLVLPIAYIFGAVWLILWALEEDKTERAERGIAKEVTHWLRRGGE